jgi:ribosomal protein S18 acetylase RimI-like enzyme
VAVVVREAVIDDALGIARVHVAGWQSGYAGLLPQGYLDGLSVEERAQRRAAALREPDPRTLANVVAIRDDDVAGFAMVGRSRDDDAGKDVGELFAIYTDPRHWGTGVGHALHEEAMQALRVAGLTSATLWVLHGNDRATAFYRRHGWVADGTTKTDWRDEVRLDEERYRLTLLTP